MAIFVTRHGETQWNVLGKKQGWTGTPLNEKGIAQAHALAKFFAGKKILRIYCSDLERAVQTAEIINETLKVKLVKTRALRELDLGGFNGLTTEQMERKIPGFFEERKKDRFRQKYPGGESIETAFERAKPVLSEIGKLDGNTLIVGHNGINRAIIGHFAKLSPEKFVEVDSPHGTVYGIERGRISRYGNGKKFEGYKIRAD